MKHFVISILCTYALLSCQRENSDSFYEYPGSKTDTTWYGDLPANATVRSFPQVFGKLPIADTFNNTAALQLNFNDSVIINVPANAFTTASGTVVTDDVVVSVINLATKGDIIKNSKPTQSYQYPLITGGALHIMAHNLGGQALQLSPGKGLRVAIKNKFVTQQSAPLMRIFLGNETAFGNNVQQSFTWVPTADTITWLNNQQNIMNLFSFTTTSLRWINCDYFSDTTLQRTRPAIITPANFTNANTVVYIVFKTNNTVLQCNADAFNKYFYTPNVPTGREVSIISISQINNEFYLSSTNAVTSLNMVQHITPQVVTKQQIDNFLNSL